MKAFTTLTPVSSRPRFGTADEDGANERMVNERTNRTKGIPDHATINHTIDKPSWPFAIEDLTPETVLWSGSLDSLRP
jgi:hypothetical protein